MIDENLRDLQHTDVDQMDPGIDQIDADIDSVDIAYMKLAIEQARIAGDMGEVPIGCVVVCNPDGASEEAIVVASAHNLRESMNDPSAHAELLAITEAARKLDKWRLVDCSVYVTLEPCIMCAGLMHQARISRCVFGAHDTKAGALGSLYAINEDERLNHRFEAVGGVCEDECASLLRDFFRKRRSKTCK